MRTFRRRGVFVRRWTDCDFDDNNETLYIVEWDGVIYVVSDG